MDIPVGLESSDISVITSVVGQVTIGSTTSTVTYYHVPFLFWLVLFLITTYIANHVIWEFIRYTRKHHTYGSDSN